MKTEAELNEIAQKQLKMAWKTAVFLGFAAVIAVLFMIYGLTQSIEAGKQRDLAVQHEMIANEMKNELIILKEQLAACQAEKK